MKRIILVMAMSKSPLRYGTRLVKRAMLSLLGCRQLVMLACLVPLITVYFQLNNNPTFFVDSRPWENTGKCGVGNASRGHLINMTEQVQQILDQMGIRYWLFYGSLWEIRRLKFALMWRGSVDIGILANKAFTGKTWSEFMAPFKSAGFIVSGNKESLLTKGSMTFRKNPFHDLSVKVYIFSYCNGVAYRPCLWSWLFFKNYKKYHTFPTWFLEPALPRVRFGSLNIPVPRGGLEILRYIYPTHWNDNVTDHCYFEKMQRLD